MAQIRSALDGFSERVRYLYGKRISNKEVIEGIELLGEYPDGGYISTYNISNFPGETPADKAEFEETLAQANPTRRVIMVLHTTPFRPSPATPMQWEPASLFPAVSDWQTGLIIEKGPLKAVHEATLESPWSHFLSLLVERATATPESDRAFHSVVFGKSLNRGTVAMRLAVFQHNFDTEPYLKGWDIGDPEHPTAFLTGAIDAAKMEKIATKMREQREKWRN